MPQYLAAFWYGMRACDGELAFASAEGIDPVLLSSLGCGSNDGIEVHVVDAGLWLGAQH